MSDSDQTQIAIVKETTPGVPPVSPVLEIYRTVGQPGLQGNPERTRSTEIRRDGQKGPTKLMRRSAGGPTAHEVIFGAYDTADEIALRNTISRLPTITNTAADTEITGVTDANDTVAVAAGGTAFVAQMIVQATGFTNTANNGLFVVGSSTGTTVVYAGTPTLTDEVAPPIDAQIRNVGFEGASGDIVATTTGGNALTSSALDFTTIPGTEPGKYVKIGGAAAGDRFTTTAANNDLCRVSARTANRLDFDEVPAGWAADAGSGKTIQVWTGDSIRNGVLKQTALIERLYDDHSPTLYEEYLGSAVDTATWDFTGDFVTVNYDWLSFDAAFDETRRSGATERAAPTFDPLVTTADLGTARVSGQLIAGQNHVIGSSIAVANALRRKTSQGSVTTVGFGYSGMLVTVNLSMYFDTKVHMDTVNNNADSSYMVPFEDGDRLMVMSVPQMKLVGWPDNPGQETDLTVDFEGQAEPHKTLGYTIQNQWFHHVEYTPAA